MDENIPGKQIFHFYKSTFERTIDAIILFQEQNEKTIDLYLEQIPDLPEESRKAIQDWRAHLKKGTLDFKTGVDEGFKKAEKHFFRPAGRRGSNRAEGKKG